jgi:hypothetical protein
LSSISKPSKNTTKATPTALVIPSAFVRHWHNLRVSTAWHKTGSDTPIPNTFAARLADLKVLARAYHARGELRSFGTAVTAPQKKESAPAPVCPTADWQEFGRTTIGWSIPPDSSLRWEDLTHSQHSEFMRNWESEQRRKNQQNAA